MSAQHLIVINVSLIMRICVLIVKKDMDLRMIKHVGNVLFQDVKNVMEIYIM